MKDIHKYDLFFTSFHIVHSSNNHSKIIGDVSSWSFIIKNLNFSFDFFSFFKSVLHLFSISDIFLNFPCVWRIRLIFFDLRLSFEDQFFSCLMIDMTFLRKRKSLAKKIIRLKKNMTFYGWLIAMKILLHDRQLTDRLVLTFCFFCILKILFDLPILTFRLKFTTFDECALLSIWDACRS